jgi:hypothetical protein
MDRCPTRVAFRDVVDSALASCDVRSDRATLRDVVMGRVVRPLPQAYGITSGGEGGLNWQQMKIEIIPFLRLEDGSRVFDHNANPSDFDNYQLDYSWGPGRRPFELRVDPTAC